MAYYTQREYQAVEAYESFFSILDPDESTMITVEAMTKSDRNKLKDSDFAVPEIRKYPINDIGSTKNGIKYFKFVPDQYKDECAKNLIKAAKKFKIEISVTKDNPFLKYYPTAKIVPRKTAKKSNT